MAENEAEVKKEAVVAEEKTDKNEFTITRSKGFSYITYLRIISTIYFNDGFALIQRTNRWLYVIKTNSKEIHLDYNTITGLEVKTWFSFWDLLFSIAFFIKFFTTFEFVWIIAFGVFIICSYGKRIIIHRENLPDLFLNADGIGSDKEVIAGICSEIRLRATKKLPEEVPSEKPKSILQYLPFNNILASKISAKVQEANPIVKQLISYADIIVLAVALMIIIIYRIRLAI